jgi:hypothetical protein
MDGTENIANLRAQIDALVERLETLTKQLPEPLTKDWAKWNEEHGGGTGGSHSTAGGVTNDYHDPKAAEHMAASEYHRAKADELDRKANDPSFKGDADKAAAASKLHDTAADAHDAAQAQHDEASLAHNSANQGRSGASREGAAEESAKADQLSEAATRASGRAEIARVK